VRVRVLHACACAVQMGPIEIVMQQLTVQLLSICMKTEFGT
jgi:hypothetical protein